MVNARCSDTRIGYHHLRDSKTTARPSGRGAGPSTRLPSVLSTPSGRADPGEPLYLSFWAGDQAANDSSQAQVSLEEYTPNFGGGWMQCATYFFSQGDLTAMHKNGGTAIDFKNVKANDIGNNCAWNTGDQFQISFYGQVENLFTQGANDTTPYLIVSTTPFNGGGAIPEPITLALFGAGLLGVAAIRRRGIGVV